MSSVIEIEDDDILIKRNRSFVSFGLHLVVVYMLIYAATNLGIFGVIIAMSRKTRSGEISSRGGPFSYAPGLGALATIFLASLAGIPPLGGWVGKFAAFQSTLTSGSGWGYALALIGAVNSVVASGYYGSVMREIWMKPMPDGDTTPILVPGSLQLALVPTAATTLVLGILPGVAMHFGDIARLTSAFGG